MVSEARTVYQSLMTEVGGNGSLGVLHAAKMLGGTQQENDGVLRKDAQEGLWRRRLIMAENAKRLRR